MGHTAPRWLSSGTLVCFRRWEVLRIRCERRDLCKLCVAGTGLGTRGPVARLSPSLSATFRGPGSLRPRDLSSEPISAVYRLCDLPQPRLSHLQNGPRGTYLPRGRGDTRTLSRGRAQRRAPGSARATATSVFLSEAPRAHGPPLSPPSSTLPINPRARSTLTRS